MNDEMLRVNYRILKDRLNVIKGKMNLLDDAYEDLVLTIKDSFCVDDDLVFEEELSNIKNDFIYINNELVNDVIPYVNNKI